MHCVRLHWTIEDDGLGSLEMQWHEDGGTWCTRGTALWALGVLRAMAYTLVRCIRRRNCREKRGRHAWRAPRPWRKLLEAAFDALRGYGLTPETA